MLPFMHHLNGECDTSVFLDDNALVHKAKTTCGWYKERDLMIEPLKGAVKSLDLNVIESN